VTGRVPSTISRQAALCAAAAVRPIRIRNTLVAARVSYADKSLAWGHGFQAHVGPMRSYSRGWVRLASADLAEAPHIRFKDRNQQARRPVAAKATHPLPVAQPPSPSNLQGGSRMQECRTSGSCERCPEMGIPTSVGSRLPEVSRQCPTMSDHTRSSLRGIPVVLSS
jgi:hypothetical protein